MSWLVFPELANSHRQDWSLLKLMKWVGWMALEWWLVLPLRDRKLEALAWAPGVASLGSLFHFPLHCNLKQKERILLIFLANESLCLIVCYLMT